MRVRPANYEREELRRDKIYEFTFLGGPLNIRGWDAAPLRPMALPVR
ncbi:hypothetical protein [Stenotrophomonas sp. Iso1]|nr:hypothetical protein [Stenotrophomonas sp. Iso1]